MRKSEVPVIVSIFFIPILLLAQEPILVKNIHTVGGSYPEGITAVDNGIFLKANNVTDGNELWFSDGTDAGTQMVCDINFEGGSEPRELTWLDSRLFFNATNAINGI